MCIALPRKIVAVVDAADMLVEVCDEAVGRETVSAVLLVTPELPIRQLVGNFVLVHAGFAIALIDEVEARSRLQMFAAMRGESDALDLDEFYTANAGVTAGTTSAIEEEIAGQRRETDSEFASPRKDMTSAELTSK